MNVGDGFRSLQQVFGNEVLDSTMQKAGRGGVAGREGVQSKGDEAHLSSAATLATHASDTSDVRLEKVAAIQQALAAGTYKVSSEDVAQSLMNQMLQR